MEQQKACVDLELPADPVQVLVPELQQQKPCGAGEP